MNRLVRKGTLINLIIHSNNKKTRDLDLNVICIYCIMMIIVKHHALFNVSTPCVSCRRGYG